MGQFVWFSITKLKNVFYDRKIYFDIKINFRKTLNTRHADFYQDFVHTGSKSLYFFKIYFLFIFYFCVYTTLHLPWGKTLYPHWGRQVGSVIIFLLKLAVPYGEAKRCNGNRTGLQEQNPPLSWLNLAASSRQVAFLSLILFTCPGEMRLLTSQVGKMKQDDT